MSKINYSEMSKKVPDVPENTTPAIITDIDAETKAQVASELETETEPEVTVTEPETKVKVFGTVGGCRKLNVRTSPNKDSEVVRVIDVGEEVTVDLDNSTDEWYKVQIYGVADIHGYCMKEYINIEK